MSVDLSFDVWVEVSARIFVGDVAVVSVAGECGSWVCSDWFLLQRERTLWKMHLPKGLPRSFRILHTFFFPLVRDGNPNKWIWPVWKRRVWVRNNTSQIAEKGRPDAAEWGVRSGYLLANCVQLVRRLLLECWPCVTHVEWPVATAIYVFAHVLWSDVLPSFGNESV